MKKIALRFPDIMRVWLTKENQASVQCTSYTYVVKVEKTVRGKKYHRMLQYNQKLRVFSGFRVEIIRKSMVFSTSNFKLSKADKAVRDDLNGWSRKGEQGTLSFAPAPAMVRGSDEEDDDEMDSDEDEDGSDDSQLEDKYETILPELPANVAPIDKVELLMRHCYVVDRVSLKVGRMDERGSTPDAVNVSWSDGRVTENKVASLYRVLVDQVDQKVWGQSFYGTVNHFDGDQCAVRMAGGALEMHATSELCRVWKASESMASVKVRITASRSTRQFRAGCIVRNLASGRKFVVLSVQGDMLSSEPFYELKGDDAVRLLPNNDELEPVYPVGGDRSVAVSGASVNTASTVVDVDGRNAILENGQVVSIRHLCLMENNLESVKRMRGMATFNRQHPALRPASPVRWTLPPPKEEKEDEDEDDEDHEPPTKKSKKPKKPVRTSKPKSKSSRVRVDVGSPVKKKSARKPLASLALAKSVGKVRRKHKSLRKAQVAAATPAAIPKPAAAVRTPVPVVASYGLDPGWTCATCSFINKPALKWCEMCEGPRPDVHSWIDLIDDE